MISIRLRPASAVMLAACLLAATTLAQKASAPAALKPPSNDDCLACHADASATGANGRSIAVAPEKFVASVHGQAGIACVDCHADLAKAAEFPHPEKLAPVACATCHDAAGAQYDTSVHAQARRASPQSVAAACKDCHGTHDILPSSNPDSSTYHFNLPATCGRCHGNADIIRRGRIAIGNVVAQFQDSIHGQALFKSGLMVAPDCKDCHNAHDIRRKTDPASRVFRTTIPATCGKCHEGVERLYQAGVHGDALAKGRPDAPVCVTCHTAHRIQRTEGASWKAQVLAECGSCHPESNRTYHDTFHGQETQLGFMRVATCADCHGAHDIFPRRDARSTVSSARLVSTCRKCHAGANASFAKYDPHADRRNRERNPWLFYASKSMEVLLIGVFAFFGIHTALWASRAVKPGRARSSRPGGGPRSQE
jgi:nitrate/TMAO reductase-like tetraheme cytochrome c subunit